ncbi:MAG: fluoride efflux transporter CrcB, partial [Blastocatellia bacterium]
FPVGTFVINVTGSFVIGALLAMSETQTGLPAHWRLALATGFLGAYTTFSTFSYETLRLLETGRAALALAYALGSVLAGLLAVWLGSCLTRWWLV